jgi:short-subunit dehydrogenase
MSHAPTFDISAVFILSVSSGIGEKLALDFLSRGALVAGTYRGELPASLVGKPNFFAVRCDLMDRNSAKIISDFLQSNNFKWDVFVSCVGQLAPVGLFFETDFDSWGDSFEINSVAQLRALHAAYSFRHIDRLCHVVFFAGGGTNGPFRSYSSYCLGKIALIKMCELLDDENSDLNIFIVGTGWVQTKIHNQTLAAGSRAGPNFDKTQSFVNQNFQGTKQEDIAAMIYWGIAQGRTVSGGRNFSLVHDPWRAGGEALANSLKADINKYKIRRFGNDDSNKL